MRAAPHPIGRLILPLLLLTGSVAALLLPLPLPQHPYHLALVRGICLLAAVTGGLNLLALLLRPGSSLRHWYQASAGWNLGMGLAAFLLMFLLNPLYTGRFTWLRLLYIWLPVLLYSRAFYLGVVRREGAGLLRAMFTVLYLLGMLFHTGESVALFMARSQADNRALASRTWFARYWHLNEGGYRDSIPLDTGKRQLLLLGDSFTAGHGIPYENGRFGNLLMQRLPGWQVRNLGQNGADLETAAQNLAQYTDPADYVLWVGYLNDLDELAAAHLPQVTGEGIPALSLVHGSFLANFLWWSRQAYPEARDTEAEYAEVSRAAQATANVQVMAQARGCWSRMQAQAQARGARLGVVLFPALYAPQASAPVLHRWRAELNELNIPVLDLSPLIQQTALPRLVNPTDAHPAPELQGPIADSILAFLQHQNDWK